MWKSSKIWPFVRPAFQCFSPKSCLHPPLPRFKQLLSWPSSWTSSCFPFLPPRPLGGCGATPGSSTFSHRLGCQDTTPLLQHHARRSLGRPTFAKHGWSGRGQRVDFEWCPPSPPDPCPPYPCSPSAYWTLAYPEFAGNCFCRTSKRYVETNCGWWDAVRSQATKNDGKKTRERRTNWSSQWITAVY